MSEILHVGPLHRESGRHSDGEALSTSLLCLLYIWSDAIQLRLANSEADQLTGVGALSKTNPNPEADESVNETANTAWPMPGSRGIRWQSQRRRFQPAGGRLRLSGSQLVGYPTDTLL